MLSDTQIITKYFLKKEANLEKNFPLKRSKSFSTFILMYSLIVVGHDYIISLQISYN